MKGQGKDMPQLELGNKNEAVKVAIRCRPINSKETGDGHVCVVEVNEKGEIFVTRPFVNEPPKQFTFDICFDSFVSLSNQSTTTLLFYHVVTGPGIDLTRPRAIQIMSAKKACS